MISCIMGHKPLLNPWNCVHSAYLIPFQPVGCTAAWMHYHLVSWWGYHWALQSAEDYGPALTFTSVYREEKLSTGRAHWTSTEWGSRWENKKIRWKRAQLLSVVNNLKEARAREEHVVAVETELSKSTIGRTEAAEAECGACCSPQHASALLLSELSDGLCVRALWFPTLLHEWVFR